MTPSAKLRGALDHPQAQASTSSDTNSPEGDDEAGRDSSLRSEKRRRLTTSDFTRRKRTAVACQFCRVRKTKCDNVRPQCGYCVRQRARCIYGDVEGEERDAEPSPTPVSNEQLMSRLEEIQAMLRRTHLTAESVSSPSAAPGLHSATSPWTGGSQVASGPSRQRNRRAPLATLRCESILGWPCFAGAVPQSEAGIDSFPLSASYEETRTIQGAGKHGGRGISEDALVPLCRKFLAEVHPRNPVLDDRELMRHARRAAEEGIGWDSGSCLVVSGPSNLSTVRWLTWR